MNRKSEECWELYNLNEDPREFVNQYDNPAYKEIIVNLKRRLNELRQCYKDTEDPLRKLKP
jgi:hypothetical protein